jgi:putative transposase
LWEHRQAIKHLRATGRKQLNEELIFTAIQELRDLTKEASVKSKQARRNQERINNNQLISGRKIEGLVEELELKEPSVPIEAFEAEIW